MISKPAPQGQATIGRFEEAHLYIADDTRVSSRHATIAPLPDGTFRLTDHSSNGTWVNGVRITSMAITTATEFRVGSTVLRIDGQV